jgi:hypothetical protein
MNPHDDTDTDLQQRFQALKRAVEAQTPAWEQCWRDSPRRPSLLRPVLRKAVLAAAAAAVVVFLVISFGSRPAAGNLALDLPPLLESQIDAAPSDFLAIAQSPRWPSDSLAPSHLNLIIP